MLGFRPAIGVVTETGVEELPAEVLVVVVPYAVVGPYSKEYVVAWALGRSVAWSVAPVLVTPLAEVAVMPGATVIFPIFPGPPDSANQRFPSPPVVIPQG